MIQKAEPTQDDVMSPEEQAAITVSDPTTIVPKSPEETAALRRFCVEAARLMKDLHCEDVLIFDVRQLTDVTSFIIIASGTSDRQLRSVADDVNDLAREHGLEKARRDTDKTYTWIVLDFAEVMVHLFEPNTRAHFDLEMMWGDAPLVHWQR